MPQFSIHQEGTFEDAITEHLTTHGWHAGDKSAFDAGTALDKRAVIEFVQTSQPKQWAKLAEFYRTDAEEKFISRLVKELDLRGMLDCLRHGITDSGIKFKLAYLKPDSNFTAELKNHFTGQNFSDAIKQYRNDRDPRELLFQFKKRTLVHFALDSDEVHFTTKLDTDKTRFFPFNKGHKRGAGNPPNEQGSYKTAYFWEEVLQADSWLEIIGRFIHLQKDEYRIEGKIYNKETMVFPR